MAVDYTKIPFVQARWYQPTDGRTVHLIVIHSMEAPEKGSTAENVAKDFATTDRKASAHYCVDNGSVVQCLQTKDVAYAAPGANHDGVHIELAGYARQTKGEWADDYSRAMLEIAAGLCAKVLIPKFKIPVTYLNYTALKKSPSVKGITTHWEVTKAWKKSSHTDPGKSFPMNDFLTMIRSHLPP